MFEELTAVDPGGLRAVHLPRRARAAGPGAAAAAGVATDAVQENRDEVEEAGGAGERAARAGTANANQAVSDKVPRNAPCPCGSGKKYKKCHGAAA